MKKITKKPAVAPKLSTHERILGCLKGKAIGGTLGTPVEGKMELLDLKFYDPVPQGILPNDDFDLQLMFLESVENAGGLVDARLLAKTWLEQNAFPFDEYGVANLNIRRGFLPPVTGAFDNPFKHCMGSPIRSEIWAMLAPGRPALAAYFAMQDSMIDHGLEGMSGEMFFAAFESAAFSGGGFEELIRFGLSCTPKKSLTYQAVRFTLDHYREYDWKRLREEILKRFGHPNFTEAPQNIAFTLIGLLYHPNDFDQALLITTNCGYDTDCTAATLGAMWGLVYGDRFPERWLAPIGEVIRASHGVHDMSMSVTLTALADQIIEIQKKVLKRYAKVSDAALEKKTLGALENPWKVSFGGANELGVDYGGLPVLKGNKKISFTGKVKDVYMKYPFEAKRKGSSVNLRVDPKAPFIPRHAGVTFEMANGNLHTLALVTPHELYAGKISGPSDFDAAIKTDLGELFRKKSLRELTLDERLFHLRDLKETGWIHVAGYFHLSTFGKYRLAPFAECQVTSFLDGNQIHEAAEGRPCIPAPHRGEKTMVADVELRAGWHRWDIFLNKDKQLRDGKVCLTVSDAYTKQLTDFCFHRAKGGVYEY